MRSVACLLFVVCAAGAGILDTVPVRGDELSIEPATLELAGNYAVTQVVVRQVEAEVPQESWMDLTRTAEMEVADPEVARLIAPGRLLSVANGETQLIVRNGESTRSVPIRVTGVQPQPQIAYHRFVAPILSKRGCNMGACHASQYGKGGLILSVFGFDPAADREAIVKDRRQRRINPVNVEKSLLLLKPTMQVPHGGGRRLQKDSLDYRILADWLASGAAAPQKDAPKAVSLEITPSRRRGAPGMQQQLRVTAVYDDESTRDVTAWARFDSMDDAVLQVDEQGLVTTIGRGQAPVMARFEGQAAIATVVVPYSDDDLELPGWENRNFVDELASAKFRELGLKPVGLCDDATFLRRAYLDAIGGLPTVEETRAFLDSTDPDKRDKLIDRLLGLTGDPAQDIYNDRYASYWTLKWSDLLRNTSNGNSVEQAMWAMHNWIRESFRTNKPFDAFVSELITAKGSVYRSGPANYFRINRNSSELAESTAQLFLGVRLQCAKCHHHPFEKYSQADYYGFAAFFSRVGTKNSQEFGLFGREQVVLVKSSGDVRHPRTGQNMPPTPLDAEPTDHPLDRRIALAEWMTTSDYFAQSVVNRYVSYLLGQGLVEPVDDLRATNPPSNVELMERLTKSFRDSGFNIKQLIRTIMRSRLYQLDSQPTAENVADTRFYSAFQVKRLGAEPLLDALDQVCGVQTKFRSLPLGTRAIDLPDAEYPNYFLNTFGKPKRASVCECERVGDANLAQALHTINGDILSSKLTDKNGRIASLLERQLEPEAAIAELYMATLNRPPKADEMQAAKDFLADSPTPRVFYEDLLWALINSKHFLFVH